MTVVAIGLTLTACATPRPLSPDAIGYLVIAAPANERLDHAFDAYRETDRNNLAASIADLHTIAAVERDFDRRLRELALTDAAGRAARRLIAANELRAAVTAHLATSTSLTTLRALDPRLAAADETVEAQVRTLRRLLGLPPPEAS